MAKRQSQKGLGLSLVLSLGTLLVIAVSLFVLSGRFASLVTTILKPKAALVQPVITDRFVDAFNDGKINEDKWTVSVSGGSTVTELATDKLRMVVPATPESENAQLKAGRLVFDQMFRDNADFRVTVVLDRPVLNKDGAGQSGIAFTSSSTLDDEAAYVVWRVASKSGEVKSEVIFNLNAPNGDSIIKKTAVLNSNVATLQLTRVNGYYRGAYRPGKDMSGDVELTVLGEVKNAELGNNGQIRLLTNNVGTKTRVVGRFDTAYVHWQRRENAPTPTPGGISFYDNFANGVIAAKWATYTTTGAQIRETVGDNLAIVIPAGAVNGKPGHGSVTRKEPSVGVEKDFQIVAQLYKPKVVGDGAGVAGISFSSSSNPNKEAAQVRWVVSGSGSKLVFLAIARDGKLEQRSAVDTTLTKVSLLLRRRGTTYSAHYKADPGDPDSAWVRIGAEDNASFGEAGKFRLFANNMGSGGKYPFVTARFDQANGSVAR